MADSFVTPWTAAHQAPLRTGFPRQEYWGRVPFPAPGDLPDPGVRLVSPALAGRFFTTEPPRKPLKNIQVHKMRWEGKGFRLMIWTPSELCAEINIMIHHQKHFHLLATSNGLFSSWRKLGIRSTLICTVFPLQSTGPGRGQETFLYAVKQEKLSSKSMADKGNLPCSGLLKLRTVQETDSLRAPMCPG